MSFDHLSTRSNLAPMPALNDPQCTSHNSIARTDANKNIAATSSWASLWNWQVAGDKNDAT